MNPKNKPTKANLSSALVNEFISTAGVTPVTKDSLKIELDTLANECRSIIAEPAKLARLLCNVEFYRTNLDAEAFSLLSKLADILVKDLTQFRDNLQSIENKQNSILTASNDIEEIQINAFGISNLYTEWVEQYGNVVLPVIGDIYVLMNAAMASSESHKSETEVTENVSKTTHG